MDALARLLTQLPADFPATLFIVRHMAADTTGDVLLKTLTRHSKLPCSWPRDGQAIASRHVYLAPPDQHLMVGKGRILLTKGARENRARPSIDPLFRSAAVAYGNAVIGVLLTGYLNDGTAGLIAIQRCGGICVVQDPDDAAYAEMPRSALDNMQVDHCVPVAEMGALLAALVRTPLGARKPVPEDVAVEAKIAEHVLSDLQAVGALGDQVPFNCPNCGGVLWSVTYGDTARFRCHTGHAFTPKVLLAEQSTKIEETLWVALRMFEERRNLLRTMAKAKGGASARAASERAAESDIHIRRVRAMLQSTAAAPRSVGKPRNGP